MDHNWEAVVFKNGPVLKCSVCGFLWQPHMRKPKVSCETISTQNKN